MSFFFFSGVDYFQNIFYDNGIKLRNTNVRENITRATTALSKHIRFGKSLVIIVFYYFFVFSPGSRIEKIFTLRDTRAKIDLNTSSDGVEWAVRGVGRFSVFV